MPLVKVFARSNLSKKVPLKSLQAKLCDIWGTKPETTKLMLFRCEDWTDESFQEDCFLDIRAYGRLLVVCCEVSLFVAVFLIVGLTRLDSNTPSSVIVVGVKVRQSELENLSLKAFNQCRRHSRTMIWWSTFG